jgi:hypothetical protein
MPLHVSQALTRQGRAQVLASWDAVFSAGGKLKIRLTDVTVHAAESLGFITCVEVVDSGSQTGRCVLLRLCCACGCSLLGR